MVSRVGLDVNKNFLQSLNCGIFPEALLSEYTTFQLGGPCRALITCSNQVQLEKTIQKLAKEKLPFILIGAGSNLVVSDEGIDCFVIRYLSETPLIQRQGNDLIVEASTILDQLSLFCVQNGLEGLNYTTGIPGTVGGAIAGNAGAFGKQVGDVTKEVTALTPKGEKKKLKPRDLKFRYRDSILKETQDIVVSVKFALMPGKQEALLKEREEILQIRREKHPNLKTHPCAGSFFRNIEPTSRAGKRQAAGWFLEQVGGINLSYGGAKVFETHANIIVKSDGCKAMDVYMLSLEMTRLVKEHFNLDLIREARFVGKFNGISNRKVIW